MIPHECRTRPPQYDPKPNPPLGGAGFRSAGFLVHCQTRACCAGGLPESRLSDFEIPLPCGQHTLAPKIEACILQAAAPPLSRAYTLEIGAGSGYMAALLAQRPLPRSLYSQQRRALPAWL